jgi:hypothetical protein
MASVPWLVIDLEGLIGYFAGNISAWLYQMPPDSTYHDRGYSRFIVPWN